MGEQFHPVIMSEDEMLFSEGDLDTIIAGGALGATIRRIRQVEEDPTT